MSQLPPHTHTLDALCTQEQALTAGQASTRAAPAAGKRLSRAPRGWASATHAHGETRTRSANRRLGKEAQKEFQLPGAVCQTGRRPERLPTAP